MGKNKLKQYKVLSGILDKGKHYVYGDSVDETKMDLKVIKRLLKVEPPCLEEAKGFPALPKGADAATIEKLIASIKENAHIERQQAIKSVQAFKRQAKNGLASTLEKSSKKEHEEKVAYVKELEKLLVEKEDPKAAEKAAVAKKKADDEAAEKEAAAAKKKADEEAAEKEAAAKKKADEEAAEKEAAAKKKADEKKEKGNKK